MNPRLTALTARRVLFQLRRDPRTIALLIVVPSVLLLLLWWVYQDVPLPEGAQSPFQTLGPRIMGLFPMVLMFVITSVTTLRERTTGTMERLMASPSGRGDVVLGYALAFGLVATVQAVVLVLFTVYALDLEFAGPLWALMLIIVLDAILGTALGLAASSIASTEFQAVQMMPAILLPQMLLAGLFLDRDLMPRVLEWLSAALPLSYAIDAIKQLQDEASASGIWDEVGILAAFIVGALALGILTLRRRTG